MLVSLALCLLFLKPAPTPVQDAPFIEIHHGRHWIWVARQDQYEDHKADIESFYDYADNAYDELAKNWGLKPDIPQQFLLVYEKTGGGFASGDIGEVHKFSAGRSSSGIGISYDAFYGTTYGIKGYWAYAIMTHEMVNSFTGLIVSGGWPRDWWADDRSPFPLMTATQIEFKLIPEVSVQHIKDGLHDPLVGMFLELKNQYGWYMFRTAFQAAIHDGINWDAFGTNPSAIRTNYVAAYLQIGAPENIAPKLSGLVPGFDAAVVKDILRARKAWTALPAGSEHDAMRKAYLSGDYAACLK